MVLIHHSVLLLFCFLGLALGQSERLLLLDDFSGQDAAWIFHRDGSVKQDADAIEKGHGYLKIRLLNPDAGRECNVGISNPQPIYTKKLRQLTVQLRVKVLNAMQPGSRGWGFWKTAKNGRADNLAWFMQQSLKGSPGLSWSRFGSLYKRQAKWQDYTPVAGEWHRYKFVRDVMLNTSTYFVDGRRAFNTAGIAARGPMAFHLWIDNQVYSRSKGIQRFGWAGKSEILVDYVLIYDGASASESYPLVGSIKLNEQPRYFFDPNIKESQTSFTAKNLSADSWVIANVNAEPSAYGYEADYLKMIIKHASGADSLCWDGSQPPTRFLRVSGGDALKITFENSGTPFLNRLLVLNSPSGKMLLNHSPGKVDLPTFSNGSKNLVCVVAVKKPVAGRLIFDVGNQSSAQLELDPERLISVRHFSLPPGHHTLKLKLKKNNLVERIFLYQE